MLADILCATFMRKITYIALMLIPERQKQSKSYEKIHLTFDQIFNVHIKNKLHAINHETFL